ncbi:hypothetical protein R1sor_012758 [Riccia sorocarpa]|uniref:Reverse transcriptase n=1 Tax=Riccia sorocarpa TaxID=122646 RepID=A0ABD3I8N6_9MARC
MECEEESAESKEDDEDSTKIAGLTQKLGQESHGHHAAVDVSTTATTGAVLLSKKVAAASASTNPGTYPPGFHAWVGFTANERSRTGIQEMEFMKSAVDGAEELEGEVRVVELDVEKAAATVGRFRRTAVVLQALESTPSRERVTSWVRNILEGRCGAAVCQVTVLTKREFLIVFHSETGKEAMMANPPKFLDGKIIRLVNWGARKKESFAPNMKAAWVELRNIPPFLEDQTSTLLEAVGPVMFQSLEKRTELQYATVRACVMLDISKDLPTAVGIKTPWWKTYYQPIVFTRLPDHCYQCLEKGHVAKQCPNRRNAPGGFPPFQNNGSINGLGGVQPEQPGPVDIPNEPVSNNPDEFLSVPTRRRGRPSPQSRSGNDQGVGGANQFDALMAESGEDGAELGEESLKGIYKADAGPSTRERISATASGSKGNKTSKQQGDTSVISSKQAVRDVEDVLTAVDRRRKYVGAESSSEVPDPVIRPIRLVSAARKKKDTAQASKEGENPFSSWHSVLSPSNGENQREVVFEGYTEMAEWAGRGPKKKDGMFSRPGLGPKTRSQAGLRAAEGGVADKRRALGSLDHNGCRVADRHELTTDLERSQIRERKSRDDGLNQEVKIDNWGMRRWLDSVRKEGTVVFDNPLGTRGGTALILHRSLQVLQSGTGGNCRLAWAIVQMGTERFGIKNIHAPNKQTVRMDFWIQMQEIMGQEKWCIFGDFNQVELGEDSIGKSALIRGREERMWRSLAVDKGLVDAFFCAASLEGDRFTRIARRGSRLDRARLDRVYFSYGASWMNHVHSVEHFVNTLSDHGPVGVEIPFEGQPTGGRRESYFKMDCFDLRDPEVLQKAKDAWTQEVLHVTDDRRRWSRGWFRIREVLREVKKKREADRSVNSHLIEEIAWRRAQITEESSEEEIAALQRVELKAKNQDLYEARLWRIRSRDKWLTEDCAPSRYFFAKVKAKWAREQLETLCTEDGASTSRPEEILEEVHSFYQDLFTAEETNEAKKVTQQQVLDLIQTQLSTEESASVAAVPDRTEIEATVFGMKSNKSPGYDGLTIEVLRLCWPFVGEDCVRLIHTIWAKRRVLRADCLSILKLIPKTGVRKRLSNWRPISLLSLTYKIVTKILANRLRHLLPKIVDVQQNGFVAGRQITDNILSMKICQEWASWTSQEGIFVKIDFIKAYDRVDHAFLWGVLEKMGFNATFIDLVKGITLDAKSKVHINGSYSQEISLQRGVRQGCPLAPLLFAMCTQPFIRLIQVAIQEGKLQGIQISPGKSLVHQLFADDTGLFLATKESEFQELMAILESTKLRLAQK